LTVSEEKNERLIKAYNAVQYEKKIMATLLLVTEDDIRTNRSEDKNPKKRIEMSYITNEEGNSQIASCLGIY